MLHLHSSFLLVVVPGHCFPYHIFQAFISCTGGQSVSYVLLWQPNSDCVHVFVIDCLVLFSENKYDDDESTG